MVFGTVYFIIKRKNIPWKTVKYFVNIYIFENVKNLFKLRVKLMFF